MTFHTTVINTRNMFNIWFNSFGDFSKMKYIDFGKRMWVGILCIFRKCMPIILLHCQILLTYNTWNVVQETSFVQRWGIVYECTIITNLSSTFIQASFCNDFALINGYEDGKSVKSNAHQVRGASRGSVLCDLVPTEADVRSCGARTRATRNDVIVVATMEVDIFTSRKRSLGKVMFLHLCVCSQGVGFPICITG